LAGGCELDSTGSGYGPVTSCCECGDEPSGSCATELVIPWCCHFHLKSTFNHFKTKDIIQCVMWAIT
jgi:hypothetical protein